MGRQSYSRLSETIIDKIDNMKEENQLDVYVPGKRKRVDEEEMFSDSSYQESEQERQDLEDEAVDIKDLLKVAALIIVLAAIVVIAALIILK